MESMMSAWTIPRFRVPAISRDDVFDKWNGNAARILQRGIDPFFQKQLESDETARSTALGKMGNYMSHVIALEGAQARRPHLQGTFLLMEDDASCSPSISELQALVSKLDVPPDWDVLKLQWDLFGKGSLKDKWKAQKTASLVDPHYDTMIANVTVNDDFYRVDDYESRLVCDSNHDAVHLFMSTTSLLIRMESVPRILEVLEKQPIHSIDYLIHSYTEPLTLRVYAVQRNICSWSEQRNISVINGLFALHSLNDPLQCA